MDMTMRVLTPAEQIYTDRQSTQISGQTGNIGFLLGQMEQDRPVAATMWHVRCRELDTDAFKEEFHQVMEALKTDGSFGQVLRNLTLMEAYCRASPDSSFGKDSQEYGFRVDTGQYAYLLRLDPQNRINNLIISCYQKEGLDHHLRRAEQGIRFITPDYQELFRIPDGGKVHFTRYDGKQADHVCRFIDECHFEIGDRHELFHICQFAEINARNGNTVEPVYAPLPERCFSTAPSTGELIVIERFKHGYEVPSMAHLKGKTPRQSANTLNSNRNISRAQEAAMLAGCTTGWTSPAAAPNRYNQRGQLKSAKRRDRGGAR